MCFLPECLVLQGKLKHAKYRRTTKWLRLEGTFRGHLVQPHCSSQVTYSRLPRTRYILNIYKNGESITSVNNLCQGLVTLMVKKCFWSRDNLLCVSAGAHCLLPCHQASVKTAWLHFLCTFPSGISLLPSDPPEPSLLKAPHYQIFQLFLAGDLLPFLQLHGLQYGTNVLFCFPGLKLGDKRDN